MCVTVPEGFDSVENVCNCPVSNCSYYILSCTKNISSLLKASLVVNLHTVEREWVWEGGSGRGGEGGVGGWGSGCPGSGLQYIIYPK
jgi:hypothetical protein